MKSGFGVVVLPGEAQLVRERGSRAGRIFIRLGMAEGVGVAPGPHGLALAVVDLAGCAEVVGMDEVEGERVGGGGDGGRCGGRDARSDLVAGADGEGVSGAVGQAGDDDGTGCPGDAQVAGIGDDGVAGDGAAAVAGRWREGNGRAGIAGGGGADGGRARHGGRYHAGGRGRRGTAADDITGGNGEGVGGDRATGGVKPTLTWALPRVTVATVGAPGTVIGVTLLDRAVGTISEA